MIAHSAHLNFNKDYLITGANVIDGLHLYWTDDYNEPSKIYLPSAATGFYLGQQTREYFDAIPHAPLFPPVCNYGSTGSNILKNNINGKLYQFKHRFVYRDGTKSAFSPISKVALPVNAELNSPGTNNFISINFIQSFNNVEWNDFVDSVEIAARSTNESDFSIIHTQESLNQSGFIYTWFNDSPTKNIPTNESIALYNFTPIKAKSQELLDSNRIAYGNFIEGYDNVDIPANQAPKLAYTINNTPIGNSTINQTPYGVGTIAGIASDIWDSVNSAFRSGIMFLGETKGVETITIGFTRASGDTILFVKNYTNIYVSRVQVVQDIINYIGNSAVYTNISYGNGSLFVTPGAGTITSFEITTKEYPAIISNPVKSWKRGAEHKFGIVYYDKSGRSGLVNSWVGDSIYVDDINQSTPIGAASINLSIYHRPPQWAYAYQILYGGNRTYKSDIAEGRSFIQLLVAAQGLFKESKDVWSISLKEILSLNKNTEDVVLSYGFTKGDRIKIIGLIDSNSTTLNYTNSTKSFEIVKYDSDAARVYFKFDDSINLTSFGTQPYGTPAWNGVQKNIFIEIHSPVGVGSTDITSSISPFYYEIGEVYKIVNPGNSNRAHRGTGGSLQNFSNGSPSVVTINSGDVYLKNRMFPNNNIITTSNFGSNNTYAPYGIRFMNVEESHYYDTLNSNDFDFGRVNVVDKNFKQIRRNATVRYSDVYVPDTNLNGLGTFFDVDFMDYEKAYGSIQKLYAQDKKLLVFQELKVGQAFVNESTLKDTGGQTLVQKSDQVLSDIQYYNGDFGISDCPESFAVYGFAKYFVDKFRGAVLRLSNDGINKISDYKMHTYFTDLLRNTRDSKDRVRILGVYNEINSEYILSVDTVIVEIKRTTLNNLGEPTVITRNATISPAVTWAFSEASNRWTSRLSFTPEMMLTYGIDYCTFKDGGCWLHNYDRFDSYANFYGTQYGSELEVISNMAPSNVKFFKALSVESNEKWEAPVITNQNNQETELILDDFEEIEDVYYAALLRDKTTPNVALPLFNGDDMRGNELIIKLKNSLNTFVKLFSIGIKFEQSELTNK